MVIQADHKELQYSGRIDFSEPKAPVFVFPCTSVHMRFTGATLKAHVKNFHAYWDNYMENRLVTVCRKAERQYWIF